MSFINIYRRYSVLAERPVPRSSLNIGEVFGLRGHRLPRSVGKNALNNVAV